MTVLAIEREVCDVNLARTPKYSGRIPSHMAVEAHFGFGHDGHCEVTFGTEEFEEISLDLKEWQSVVYAELTSVHLPIVKHDVG